MQFDYYKCNEQIKAQMAAEGLSVEMGYDGLAWDMEL